MRQSRLKQIQKQSHFLTKTEKTYLVLPLLVYLCFASYQFGSTKLIHHPYENIISSCYFNDKMLVQLRDHMLNFKRNLHGFSRKFEIEIIHFHEKVYFMFLSRRQCSFLRSDIPQCFFLISLNNSERKVNCIESISLFWLKMLKFLDIKQVFFKCAAENIFLFFKTLF